MESQIQAKDLSVRDFHEFFEKNKLGRLYFPEGKCADPQIRNLGNLSIDLKDLYSLMTGWKKSSEEVSLENILGVIAYGPTVNMSYEKVPVTRKKFLLFGPKIDTGKSKIIPIEPDAADFLVLMEKGLNGEKNLKPFYKVDIFDDGVYEDSYRFLYKGGINLFYRSIQGLQKDLFKHDKKTISALTEGVLIFGDIQAFKEITPSEVKLFQTKRNVLWNNDIDGYYDFYSKWISNPGYLYGKIK